jgi:hypothetical protein
MGMVDFTGSGLRSADCGLRMRIADADCEPMQIVYFFGMVDFTGSGLRSAEVETVGGGSHIF